VKSLYAIAPSCPNRAREDDARNSVHIEPDDSMWWVHLRRYATHELSYFGSSLPHAFSGNPGGLRFN